MHSLMGLFHFREENVDDEGPDSNGQDGGMTEVYTAFEDSITTLSSQTMTLE